MQAPATFRLIGLLLCVLGENIFERQSRLKMVVDRHALDVSAAFMKETDIKVSHKAMENTICGGAAVGASHALKTQSSESPAPVESAPAPGVAEGIWYE